MPGADLGALVPQGDLFSQVTRVLHTVAVEREDERAVHGTILVSAAILPRLIVLCNVHKKQKAAKRSSQPLKLATRAPRRTAPADASVVRPRP